MVTLLNNYPNLYTPAITGTITNTDWLNKITDSNSEYNKTITDLRAIKELYVSTNNTIFKKEYDKLKSTLPAVTWNATFTDVKSNANFLSPTGLLFIDIDDTSFNIESLDKNKIYAYYKSVGGKGYSIIVKCTAINLDNFKSTYTYIINDLKLNDYVDTNAIKITQSSIISYDLDLYINNESFVYSSIYSNKIDENNFVPTATLESKKEEHNAEVGTKQKVRYNNLNDFEFNVNGYVEDWNEGLNYVFVSKPFKPLQDGRKRYMMNYIRNYVWLNPNLPYFQILNSAKFINLSIGIEPLPNNIIEGQVKTILEQKNKGTLTPKIKKRKILFSPSSLMTRDEKEKVKGERQSLFNNESTTSKIYDIIEDWNFEINGKINIRAVATILNMSKTTVAKYWKNIKDYVKDLNESGINEIKLFKQHKMNIDKDIEENNIVPHMSAMTPLNLIEQVMSDENIYVIDIDELLEEIFTEL
ncbi:BT4734/BF3469 family protein [Pedobacter sp. MR2016-24]|uniref:BT4734/BF3469 family protein n=1 Tax=Pedobacter sp. MR2016-24 TaxID=2994466 RepID=UPI002246DD0B|nr:BT4734/BF3469 family protein [Pedobacter sp. MR2016-24]MCX2486586.1 hypothetical protein [Pedobacter sp. MR2016-24]